MRCDRYLEMGLLIIIPHSTMWYMIVCVHVCVRAFVCLCGVFDVKVS